jgi:Mn2+/Fe2+ NRAMP family transporter
MSEQAHSTPRSRSMLAAVAPGILIAATGVGAGDLMTASLGGAALGVGLAWAAGVGGVIKWFMTEGIARWQMATGTTLLEGWAHRLGGWIRWVFIAYLLVWTVFTGGAMVSACGVAGTGLLSLGDDPVLSKRIWGIAHSMIGLVLVLVGGFKLFEKLMSACIGLMFATVVVTAVMLKPDWGDVAVQQWSFISGLISDWRAGADVGGSVSWILGLLGGVGGTVTLLSYGYWIREEGRSGGGGWRACRLDLTLGYAMTSLFGVAMVIIGSRVEIQGSGASVALDLADQLAHVLGPIGRWVFLVGFWGAVFSSLLGVWQSIPYLFADFMSISRGDSSEKRRDIDFAKTRGYRGYLIAIALVSLPMLWLPVTRAQLLYAVFGSLFMPLLALTLLVMNNRAAWVGSRFRNGWITNVVLASTLLFFAVVAGKTTYDKVGELRGESGGAAPVRAAPDSTG